MWRLSLSLRLNAASHTEHLKGFSPGEERERPGLRDSPETQAAQAMDRAPGQLCHTINFLALWINHTESHRIRLENIRVR